MTSAGFERALDRFLNGNPVAGVLVSDVPPRSRPDGEIR